MYQQIERLKTEKQKLTIEYKNNQIEFKGEIKRINKAIRSFEKGMNELNGSSQPKRRKMTVEIENILAGSALSVKEIINRLHQAGFRNLRYQSISGMLQTYAKANKKFRKVAPATFALISEAEAKSEINDSSSEQTIVYEEPIMGDENEFQTRGENEFE